MRVRNAMAFATHKFFADNGFVYVHTPLITASDCEGAGEMFAVSTLLPKARRSEQACGTGRAVHLGGHLFPLSRGAALPSCSYLVRLC